MMASESKCINPNDILFGVNPLWLEGLQISGTKIANASLTNKIFFV